MGGHFGLVNSFSRFLLLFHSCSTINAITTTVSSMMTMTCFHAATHTYQIRHPCILFSCAIFRVLPRIRLRFSSPGGSVDSAVAFFGGAQSSGSLLVDPCALCIQPILFFLLYFVYLSFFLLYFPFLSTVLAVHTSTDLVSSYDDDDLVTWCASLPRIRVT